MRWVGGREEAPRVRRMIALPTGPATTAVGGWEEAPRVRRSAGGGKGKEQCKMDWWRGERSGRKRHGWRRRAVAARRCGGRGAHMPR